MQRSILLVTLLLTLLGCTTATSPEPTLPPILPTLTPTAPATTAPTPAPATATLPSPGSPTPGPTASPSVVVQPATLGFDGARALAHAEAQCAIGPRPTGSEALLETRAYIEGALAAEGWEVVRQDGEFMGLPIFNVVAIKGEGTPRLVGAHYDTRPIAERDPTRPDEPIVGGNDGASGVAVLLELARVLEPPPGRQLQLAFFDAEDRGRIDGWPFSVGAQLYADELPAPRPEAMVVVDMVGDADLQIKRELSSDPALMERLFQIAGALGYLEQGFFDVDGYSIIDDHRPFLEIGIPAADLIDFDYPAWHTTDDTCEQISADSLEQVGRVVEQWLEEAP